MPVERSVRIQVTGRARAGKTTLRHALSLLTAEETRPVDHPGQPTPTLDADLLLYILPGTLAPADRRLLATLPPERTLVVLNKADSIGSRWSDAAARAEQLATELGLAVFPVVASVAAHTRNGTFTDADLLTLRRHHTRSDPPLTLSHELFTAPDIAPDPEARQAVLDHWELHGVSCALAALRHDPALGPRALLQILHSATGIDPLHRELHHRYEAFTTTPGG
ncbi:hypothetical protein [Nocardia sp. NPDC004722]